jgi:hypothetical protein
MIGNLDAAITDLLRAALPGLLGGGAPLVTLAVQGESATTDPDAADTAASEPRPDDQSDQFAFDPAGIVFDPADPAYDPAALPRFTLSKPPYPGPRRVRLLTAAGDRIPLAEREVIGDAEDARVFTLGLAPSRDLAGVNGVQVLYGVVAVFTLLKLNQLVSVLLAAADAADLARGAALAAGVLALHRQELLDNSAATYDDGDYRAAVKVNSLKLLEDSSPAANQRKLQYQAEVELKITRALREDEGRPIVRVRTPGRSLDPARPVDIEIGVEA